MAEAEISQTWVSTGRGGAGNFPYTPRALAKRPVTISTPQGREVDYRKQGIAKSGRGGVGNWEPTQDESSKMLTSLEYERDQTVIKEAITKKQQNMAAEGTYVKSGRGGAGNISGNEPQQPAQDRVYSSGRGGSGNLRYGDAIPLVELNRIETQERQEVKNRPPSITTTSTTSDSGLASFTSYASAFFQALTPVENRIENMSPVSPSPTSKRSTQAGGTTNMGNSNYATYKSKKAQNDGNRSPTSHSSSSAQSFTSISVAGISTPSQAHVRSDQPYAAYSSSSNASYSYDPEMPIASGSSSKA